MGKAPHHAGTHEVQSRRVRDTANATTEAVCWRDGLTLAQHPNHHDGTRPRWTAGHTVDGYRDAPAWLDVTRCPPPGAWLAPEASTCNYANGARRTNTQRANPQSRQWLTPR